MADNYFLEAEKTIFKKLVMFKYKDFFIKNFKLKLIKLIK